MLNYSRFGIQLKALSRVELHREKIMFIEEIESQAAFG
jgi:hypothetical protein